MNMTIEEYAMRQQQVIMGQIQNGFAHMRANQERLQRFREMELRVETLATLDRLAMVMDNLHDSLVEVTGIVGDDTPAIRVKSFQG